MSIQVESTNTALEADKARTASAQKPEVENTKSASSESEESELQDEITETSDISDKTDEDEADSTESDDDEGLKDETKEDDKPKKESKLAKRLKKLSSERSRAREEAEYWKNEALKGKSPDKAEESKAQEQNPKIEGEPNPEEFDTNAAYIKAFTKWEIAQEKAALAKQSQEAQLKSDYQKQLDKHNERVNQFKSKQSDYEQVVSDFLEDRGNVNFSAALEDCILSSDLGPALFYELAKDPEKFDRLNSMNGNQALLEVGKILARLESSSETTKKPEAKVTKAPAPISPVGNGSATVAKSINDPNISFAEYEKIRMKQLSKQ